jgi:serine/threonine-protein kinase
VNEWRPSTQVGPYVLIEPIGAGGMGEVWKARDPRVGRTVAIKRLKPEHAERFKQEARAIAALNHPHICQLYDVGDDFLVMEYVDGGPLRCPQPPEQAIPLALQIADALHEAHSKGIVHRDLKPANVLVNERGATKLLDFGLARMNGVGLSDGSVTSAATVPGLVVGTVAYMSPEQAQGLPVDVRSDIFSFGLVLYELLSGSIPFRGVTAVETLSSILKDEPPPLTSSPVLEPVVRRCLAKHPGARYQSMTDVRAALEQAMAPAAPARPSIAVLPFVNMSGDPEQEYFSDGLAEEIINALVPVPGLKVIARTSAFAFKGQNVDVRRIAGALGVNHVLEGSVRKAGQRVRITAQLIVASDGSHLWSERYDRDLADVFAIQDEIARAIARELQTKLGPPRIRHQPSLAAYEAVLKGRHFYLQWTPEAQKQSERSYREALTLDPQYAQAYCELALNCFSAVTENQVAPHDAADIMSELAQRALAIDAADPDTHVVLALVAALNYDWERAGREFQLALAGPHPQPLVRQAYSGWYLMPVGRTEEALRQTTLAIQEDPLNPLLRLLVSELLLAKDDPDGETEALKLLDLHPDFWIAMGWLGPYYARLGRLDEARTFGERAHRLVPYHHGITGSLAGVMALQGETEGAVALLANAKPDETFGAPLMWFNYHAAQGDFAAAAHWLEKGIEQHDTRAPWILPNLYGPGFTASPYWPPLARKMNLPPRVR